MFQLFFTQIGYVYRHYSSSDDFIFQAMINIIYLQKTLILEDVKEFFQLQNNIYVSRLNYFLSVYIGTFVFIIITIPYERNKNRLQFTTMKKQFMSRNGIGCFEYIYTYSESRQRSFQYDSLRIIHQWLIHIKVRSQEHSPMLVWCKQSSSNLFVNSFTAKKLLHCERERMFAEIRASVQTVQ